jgi:SAM-dependent methyltransferase
MCHLEVLEFFIKNIKISKFKRKRVLEVGSRYVNGSVRPLIERFTHPKEYIGVDIEKGKFVDLILPAEKIVEYFGTESFDVVISTEVLEHVKDWRCVINNIKNVVRKGGYILQLALEDLRITDTLTIFGGTRLMI